jgi:hypothetical protein
MAFRAGCNDAPQHSRKADFLAGCRWRKAAPDGRPLPDARRSRMNGDEMF